VAPGDFISSLEQKSISLKCICLLEYYCIAVVQVRKLIFFKIYLSGNGWKRLAIILSFLPIKTGVSNLHVVLTGIRRIASSFTPRQNIPYSAFYSIWLFVIWSKSWQAQQTSVNRQSFTHDTFSKILHPFHWPYWDRLAGGLAQKVFLATVSCISGFNTSKGWLKNNASVWHMYAASFGAKCAVICSPDTDGVCCYFTTLTFSVKHTKYFIY